MTPDLIKVAIGHLRQAFPNAGHIGVTLDADQFSKGGQIEIEYTIHICPLDRPRITLRGSNLVSLTAAAMAQSESREEIVARVSRESRMSLN